MARVIAYTRVSSEEQTRGASLGDQSDRIEQWLRDNGHTLIAAYSEHGSGGSVKNRKEFTRMMADLETLRPDILICDASDRITRNALDGGKWVSHFTDLGVKLAVIEHDDGRVLDMKAYGDRAYVTNAFIIADGERDRMSQRQLKRYARATTKVNRPPWGVLLAPGDRSRRRLIADPERVPVIHEIDERVLRGESVASVVEWLRGCYPGSWTGHTSLCQMLKDSANSYVIAGVRSADTQSQLREMFAARRPIYGRNRKKREGKPLDPVAALLRELEGAEGRPPLREHPFSGLFACGACVRTGRAPADSLMAGYHATGNKHPFALKCVGSRGGKKVHSPFSMAVVRIMPLLYDKLIKLRDDRVADSVLERWAREPITPRLSVERDALERLLAACDEEEANLESQVGAAFALLASDRRGVRDEAERMLERSNANRMALSAKRAGLQSRLVDLPVPRARRLSGIGRDELRMNAEALLTGYQIDPETGTRWIDVDIRKTFEKWVRLIGPPVLYREAGSVKHGVPHLAWDFVDAVRPEPAPDFPRS